MSKQDKQPSKSKDAKKIKNEKNQKSTSSIRKPLFITTLLVLFVSYYVYKKLATPPEMPKLDLEKWWGPYPIDMKPDTSVRPYSIEFKPEIIGDLRERLLHRRSLTPPLDNTGFTYGFNTYFLTKVLDYWKNSYNFEERERFLNKYNHYITNIQGLDIHFMRVTPRAPENVTVIPILLLHGWPGSFREFYEVIPKLTSYRLNQGYVFEVVVPSLPGFGFSQATSNPGLGSIEISVILRNLMHRLGHERYYVQGGDYGHVIGSIMATVFPEEVMGFHTNMPVVLFNPLATVYTMMGSLWPRLIVEPELEDRLYQLSKEFVRLLEESGYFHIQATRPDTVGVALSDSPAGLAAYILEKFAVWTNRDLKQAADGGLLNKFALTHLLDNVMIYWATNTITSSMRLYAETFAPPQLLITDRIPTKVPTWGLKFKHEIFFQPDTVLRLKYLNYLHSSNVDEGGHFAAMENPDLLADDIYDAVDAFRKFHGVETSSPSSETKIVTPETAQTVYQFTVRDIKGREVKLDRYKGQLLIIVNVASQCGYTDNHYNELNELYEKYADRGLRILAFPCNQFGGQEPGSLKDIMTFAKNRGVKFDMFEKIEVNGVGTHPLWQFLKRVKGGTVGDFIKWNFSKFIVDRNGVPVERFGPNISPLEMEPYLAKYW